MLRYGLLTASGRDGGRAGVKVELGCAAAVKIKLPNAPSNDRNIFDDTRSGRVDECRLVVAMFLKGYIQYYPASKR